jgi:hypothetical protein
VMSLLCCCVRASARAAGGGTSRSSTDWPHSHRRSGRSGLRSIVTSACYLATIGIRSARISRPGQSPR